MPPSKKPIKKKAPPARTAKGAEDEGPRYHQKHPGELLPIPGEPPPLLANYEGKAELLRENPTYTVELDAGAFMWLWRIAESKAMQHHLSGTTKLVAPEQARVSLHAAAAFRTAAGSTSARLSDLSGGRKRVLKRI